MDGSLPVLVDPTESDGPDTHDEHSRNTTATISRIGANAIMRAFTGRGIDRRSSTGFAEICSTSRVAGRASRGLPGPPVRRNTSGDIAAVARPLDDSSALLIDARELYRDDRVALFAAGEAFLVRWDDSPTMKQMDAMAAVSRPYEATVPGGCGLFNIVASGKATISPELRARATEVSADPKRFGRFRVHVILLEGLRALTAQLFINTFARLYSPPVPTVAVRSVDASCEWAAPHLRDTGWTLESLRRVHAKVLEA